MADPEKPQTRVTSVLDDPSAQAIANVYADSFLTAAEQTGVEGGMSGALEEFTSFMDDVLKAHPAIPGSCSLRVSSSGMTNWGSSTG